ncbi:MAG TPA: glycosyltransferase family 2 protein [Bacteroidota bacterium]
MSVSVIILTKNEENNITDCLQSVAWAEERIVVDSGSKDGTVERARQLATKVLDAEWKGFGATKNLALEHATCAWILWLDADERVTSEAAVEIQEIVHESDSRFDAYDVARRAYFLGRWIKHCGWYPSRVTRLFRRSKGRFSESHVHEELLMDGQVGHLRNDFLHYTDPNLVHYFRKFNRYTSLAAQDARSARRRFSLSQVLLRPGFMFAKMYIFRLGFLDGMQGLILCLASSAYVFTKYAKLWELQKKRI